MRKFNAKFIAFVVFIAFVALTGCAKREITNANSKGKNIICFGDSLTFGYGANKGEDYPTALAKIVKKPVINSGIDADTTIEALLRFKSDVLEREPYLVLIEFSGNDFLRKIPIETTTANIRTMIKEAQQAGAMVGIVDISAGMFLQEYREAQKKLAYETGCIFIPGILDGIITNPSMKSDFLHPNAGGYKTIAERIHKAIKPYLGS